MADNAANKRGSVGTKKKAVTLSDSDEVVFRRPGWAVLQRRGVLGGWVGRAGEGVLTQAGGTFPRRRYPTSVGGEVGVNYRGCRRAPFSVVWRRPAKRRHGLPAVPGARFFQPAVTPPCTARLTVHRQPHLILTTPAAVSVPVACIPLVNGGVTAAPFIALQRAAPSVLPFCSLRRHEHPCTAARKRALHWWGTAAAAGRPIHYLRTGVRPDAATR